MSSRWSPHVVVVVAVVGLATAGCGGSHADGQQPDAAAHQSTTAAAPSSAPPADSAAAERVAAAFNAMATPRGGSGTGYRLTFEEKKFIEGPKGYSGSLGSITWTVNATFTAEPGTRSAWGAGIQAFADKAAATAYGQQLRSDESTCSTQPRQVHGFSDGTTAQVCMDNGSPSGPHVNVTIIRGQLLINFVASAQKEPVAIAAAKDLSSSLEAAAQGLAAQLA